MCNKSVFQVVWHVSTWQLDLTSSIVEVTFNHSQRALLFHMIIKILLFRECSTLIWASYWVTATHRPVVLSHIIVCRFILVSVFTTEGTLVTVIVFMIKELPS